MVLGDQVNFIICHKLVKITESTTTLVFYVIRSATAFHKLAKGWEDAVIIHSNSSIFVLTHKLYVSKTQSFSFRCCFVTQEVEFVQ